MLRRLARDLMPTRSDLVFGTLAWALIMLAWAAFAHAQVPVPDGPFVTGNITTTQNVAVNANGKCSFGYAISGTWTGTIVVEAQDQSGAWNATVAVPAGASPVASFTANSGGQGSIAGFKGVRFRGNTVASGTAAVSLALSPGCLAVASPLPVTQSGSWTFQPGGQAACGKVIPINQTASTDIYTSTNKVRICGINLISATQQGISLSEGTGSVCATGTAFLIGGAGGTMQVLANGGIAIGAGGPILETQTAADHLCLIQSASGNVSGFISYSDGTP